MTGALRDFGNELIFRERDLHRERINVIRQLRQAVDNPNDPNSRTRRRQILTDHGPLDFIVSWDANPDQGTKTYTVRMILGTGESKREETVTIPTQLISAQEFLQDATNAGFVSESLYGNNAKSPYNAITSLWQIHVLKKPW